MTVFGYLIFISRDFLRFYLSVFLLALVLIVKIYQTPKPVFCLISKHHRTEPCYKAYIFFARTSGKSTESGPPLLNLLDVLINN